MKKLAVTLFSLALCAAAYAQAPGGGGPGQPNAGSSAAPNGPAGGSLGGTYPNPTVVTNANLTGDTTSVGNATTTTKLNGNTPGGTCTNQFARSLSTSAVPTCASIANADMPAYAATGTLSGGNPTGTGATGGVMMGLGATCAITPAVSGRVLVSFNFTHANGVLTTDTIQTKRGTGAAPANNAGATGTNVGNQRALFEPTATSSNAVNLTYIVTGLTTGTSNWFDFLLATGSAGNIASVSGVDCSLEELP